MTLLGKILVIVNLAFSLVTGALIVTVFVTRTNWKNAYEQVKKNETIAVANAKAYGEEVEEVKKQVKTAQETLAAKQEQFDKELASRAELVTAAQEALRREQAQNKVAGTLNTTTTEEIRRRKAEVENLQRQLAEMEAKVADSQRTQKKFQNDAMQARINYTSEHERNRQLIEENEKLAKNYEAERARSGGSMSASVQRALKPPPDDVQGVVLESDPKTGLVTISIGSDSGINVGHTLEVYRFEPRPEYVGMIRIIDADFHKAVARAVLPLVPGHGPIQKGDRVASKIR